VFKFIICKLVVTNIHSTCNKWHTCKLNKTAY